MKNLLPIITLILGACQTEELAPPDHPCYIAEMRVLSTNARFDIFSTDDRVYITVPYNGYELTYYVLAADFDCIGFLRESEDFEVKIKDSKQTCTFVVPEVNH